MADNENFELETLRISELPSVDTVDKETDVLVVSRKSTANIDDYRSYKVTPEKLLSDVGVTYTAGTNVSISSTNVISASYPVVTTTDDGLMLSTDKAKLDNIAPNANNYTLPVATDQVLGGVKQGNNITIDNNGVISAQTGPTYTAGSNVQISDQNVISATDTTYSVATATTDGLMSSANWSKLDSIENNANNYSLPVATTQVLGGVKQGTNVSIANDGTLSATDTTYAPASGSADGLMSSADWTKLDGIEANANNYSLPVATDQVLGGVKQGTGVSIAADGTISATGGGGGATALSGLSDVDITSPQDGQALVYDYANSMWVNGSSGSSVTTLSGLTDVTLTTPQQNQVLTFNGTNWENANAQSGSTTLGGLTDVTISSASNGQVLTYDSASSEWKNAAIPTPTNPALGDLTNVTLTTPTTGQALVYNSVSSEWENGSVASSVSTLSDVNLNSLADGEILKYDSATSKWVNATESGGASDLDDLNDVDITTPQEGDTLVYDSTNSKWVNGAGGGGGSAKQTAVTQAQYDALVQAGTVDPTMEYFITDGIPAQVFPWTEITGTLTAGQTSLVFSNAAITTNSTIEPYVDDSFYWVKPTAVVIANGSVTLTFNEQAVDIPVKVRIS